MNREEMQRISDEYREKFGEGIMSPPLDFGQSGVTLDELYGYAQAAIDSGKPIDWDEILDPIPEGCFS